MSKFLASSIFEPNLKCLWRQMPAWKDKATSKATREDRTRLTSRIKNGMDVWSQSKNWGHIAHMAELWLKVVPKYGKLESYEMGPGCFNKYQGLVAILACGTRSSTLKAAKNRSFSHVPQGQVVLSSVQHILWISNTTPTYIQNQKWRIKN